MYLNVEVLWIYYNINIYPWNFIRYLALLTVSSLPQEKLQFWYFTSEQKRMQVQTIQ